MEIESVIRRLEGHGAVFELVGEQIKLRIKSEHAPAPEHLAHLRRHRAEVIALLRLRQSNDSTYRRQLSETMRRICSEPYKRGMIGWLQGANGELHTKITAAFPDEIDLLCQSRVAPHVLQNALDRFFETFRMAGELYEGSEATQENSPGLNDVTEKTSRDGGQDENSR